MPDLKSPQELLSLALKHAATTKSINEKVSVASGAVVGGAAQPSPIANTTPGATTQ